MTVKMNSSGEQVYSYSEILGRYIKNRRIQLEMSQNEFAHKIGYTSENSRVTIGKIEAGKQELTVSKLKLIAKVLDVPVEVLVTLDHAPSTGESAYNLIIKCSDRLDSETLKRLATYFEVLAEKESI